MRADPIWLVLGFAAIWLISAQVACAGIISEVVPAPIGLYNIDFQVFEFPAVIELSDMAHQGQAQIIIIDATPSPTRYGTIKQVIPVNTRPGAAAGSNIRLVVAGTWPEHDEPFASMAPTFPWMFTYLGDKASLSLFNPINGEIAPRSILLFDRPTGLKAGDGKLANLSVGDASLLDVVTICPPHGSARPYQLEPVLEFSRGAIVIRTPPHGTTDDIPLYLTGADRPDTYLIGTPDLSGRLTNYTHTYWGFTPGLANPMGSPIHFPEPATALILLAASAPFVLSLRRKARRYHAAKRV